MMLMICADVLLRNVAHRAGDARARVGNEVSEDILYLITLLAAPWLLRQGQHIRVDILLRALPAARRPGAANGSATCSALACCLCYRLVRRAHGAGASYQPAR